MSFPSRHLQPPALVQVFLATLLLCLAATLRAHAQATPPAPNRPPTSSSSPMATSSPARSSTAPATPSSSRATWPARSPSPSTRSRNSTPAAASPSCARTGPSRASPPPAKSLPRTIAYADGKLTVTHPSAAPEVVPTAQIANIIDQATYTKETTGKSGFLNGWTGALNGGATIVRSTDYGETLTAGIAMVRAMPTVSFLPTRDKTSFDLQETYGKLTSPVIPQTTPPSPAAVTETSIFHADAERDEYFSARFFALGQTAFDHNYSQGLNLQQIYGGGIGYTALKDARQELDLKATIQYEKQILPDRQQQRQPRRLHHLRDLPPHPAEEVRLLRVRQLHSRVQHRHRLLRQRLRNAHPARLQTPRASASPPPTTTSTIPPPATTKTAPSSSPPSATP